MKTTIDLPDYLVKEMKLRAVHEGKKLKEVAAELLSKALQPEKSRDHSSKQIRGIPLLAGKPLGKPSGKSVTGEEMQELVKQLDEQEDLERYERSFRR